MITAESKPILAKLMATEDITVEHRKVTTASFNPKTRVLTCPIWYDRQDQRNLYDSIDRMHGETDQRYQDICVVS